MTRLAALLVPAATVAIATAALAVAAAPRSHIAARVYGGPTHARGAWSVQLTCARHAVGVEDRVAREGLVVSIAGSDQPAACRGAEGVAEVRFEGALEGPARVIVREASGRVLADGVADVSKATWRSGTRTRGARLPRRDVAGELPGWEVAVDGGGLPVGQEGFVLLRAPTAHTLLAPVVSGQGVVVGALQRVATVGWLVPLTPTFGVASMHVDPVAQPDSTAGDPAALGSAGADVRLPVVAGAVGVRALRREEGRIRATLWSAEGRTRSYARVEDDEGRRAGATITLRADASGTTTGEVDLPADDRAPSWLVVAGDAAANDDSAFGWPLLPAATAGEARDGRVTADVLWVDGLAPELAIDRRREERARWAVAALVVAGGLLEIALLFEQARASGAALRAHLRATRESATDDTSLEEPGVRRLLVATALFVFGFAVIGVILVAGLR